MMKPKCRYYNGESECPYQDTPSKMFWQGEKTVCEQKGTLEDFFNSTAPGDYPEWCKELGNDIEMWALATLVYNITAKLYPDVDEIWEKYGQKEILKAE